MLNAVRNQGFLYSFAKAMEYGAGYKLKFWLTSPLQTFFKAKNLIGYLFVPAIHQGTARSKFEFHLPDCDINEKDGQGSSFFMESPPNQDQEAQSNE